MRLPPLRRGQLVLRLAETPGELDMAQSLRHRAFLAARGMAGNGGRDADRFDTLSHHLLVLRDGGLVACCRLRLFSGGTVEESYTAQFYDLTPFSKVACPMLELGRFCLSPEEHDPDILRLAWAGLAAIVDQQGVGFLFGCSSFDGADPQRHGPALAALRGRIGPDAIRPGIRSRERVSLAGLAAPMNAQLGMMAMPPLLRSYLGIGGWVSDHAVIDRDLDTLHVFTALEIASIPPARARALRAIAQDSLG